MIPFFDAYGAIVAWVFSGETELNERTGVRVKVGRGGTAFRVDLRDGLLPTVGFRKTFPKSAAAEGSVGFGPGVWHGGVGSGRIRTGR